MIWHEDSWWNITRQPSTKNWRPHPLCPRIGSREPGNMKPYWNPERLEVVYETIWDHEWNPNKIRWKTFGVSWFCSAPVTSSFPPDLTVGRPSCSIPSCAMRWSENSAFWNRRDLHRSQISTDALWMRWLPSGELTCCYMENGPVEIVDFPMKNGGSFHGKMLVYQRVVNEYWNWYNGHIGYHIGHLIDNSIFVH